MKTLVKGMIAAMVVLGVMLLSSLIKICGVIVVGIWFYERLGKD